MSTGVPKRAIESMRTETPRKKRKIGLSALRTYRNLRKIRAGEIKQAAKKELTGEIRDICLECTVVDYFRVRQVRYDERD